MYIYDRIRLLFMFPHTIIVVLWTYSYIIKQAKVEVLENPENHNLSKAELFFRATIVAGSNKEYGASVCDELEKKMGIVKYVLPITFWSLIYKILC